MNRIEFIKTSLAAAAGTFVLPTLLTGCKDKTKNDTAIIILGAGMAGITAAKTLKDNGFTNVIVLEARTRTGGRIFTDRSLGVATDMGASWIHGPGNAVKKNPITKIADDAGATRFMTDDESLAIYDLNGALIPTTTTDTYYADYEKLFNTDVPAIQAPNKSLKDAIQEVNPAYLTDPIMVYQLGAYAEFDTGGSIEEMSSQYWQDDEAYPGKDVLFPNGYDAIINHLAAGLDIRLETVVQSINHAADEVVVTTSKGEFRGKHLICTLPLGVLKTGNIGFTPALPTPISEAISVIKMGYTNKIAMVFPTIFWDENLQYVGCCTDAKGKYSYIMNVKKFSNANMLMTFGFGTYGLALESLTDAQIEAEIMVILRKIYGNSIPNPSQILVSRWTSDPYAKGAYSFASVNSSPSHFAAFEQQINNRLFFAGEHTTHDYRGTVHGAYLSGEREAEKIVEIYA